MEIKYYMYKIRMLILIVVLFGSINSAFYHLGYNTLNLLNNLIIKNFNYNINLNKNFNLFVGICAIAVALNTTTWLPFLGESVLPSSIVPLSTITGDTKIKVKVSPNTKVAYWSALPNKKHYVRDAYDKYQNSGVVLSDNNGYAILTFNKGVGYKVPGGTFVEPHVHYRELHEDWAMMGPVRTHYL
jgi:hypothetical protein